MSEDDLKAYEEHKLLTKMRLFDESIDSQDALTDIY